MTSSADITTPGTPHSEPHRQHYGLTFAVLALAAGTFSILQSLVAPALPEIQRELHASATAVTWVLTAYLLSASILTPIVGRLGDMFGKERTLVISLVVLGAGTLLAALATNISVMIVARVIQGCGGAIFPLAFGIIRDEFPRHRVATGDRADVGDPRHRRRAGHRAGGPDRRRRSTTTGCSGFPSCSSWWRRSPPCSSYPSRRSRCPGASTGSARSCSRHGWSACWSASARARRWGWGDPRILGLFAAAAVLLVLWVVNELRADEPLVDMAMMRVRGVWTVNAAAFLVGAGMYSAFVLIPQFTSTPASAGYGFDASVTAGGAVPVADDDDDAAGQPASRAGWRTRSARASR